MLSKIRLFYCLTIFSFVSPLIPAIFAKDATVDPLVILTKSDSARGATLKGLIWNIEVASTEDGDTTSQSYGVKCKGNDALVETTAPAKKKGEIMLFNDRNLWFFKPGLKKPVSISPRQRLSGQAANGDIASTNYARDYEPQLLAEETVEGKPSHKLMLKAKGKNVTYDGIRYWISKDQNVGVKAEFLTVQGSVFKTAIFEYNNNLKTDTGTIPFISKMTIVDAAFPENKTIIKYDSPSYQDHADSIFNVNNLVR